MRERLRTAVLASLVIASLVFAVVALRPERALAEDPVTEPRLISVSGEATVAVKPDLVTISFGVETNAATAKEAQQTNTSKMNNVVAALKAAGIRSEDIQTSNFSLYPVYGWEGDRPGGTQVLTGYRCNNTVTARVKSVTSTGTVIDAAINAGATNVGSLNFGLQDPDPAKNEALAMAVANARSKAEVMAKAAGVTITGIYKISDGYATVTRMEAAPYALKDAATPIESGTVTVTATVRMDFTF
ncbi:MAG: SIMPL domain-containing protein [Firmicutes bacterium]|jgi:uncharacterized protein YggE|nr:SIMPL domain-containing protein [Candidatus Fermentithermobacillaceae bacterium]